MSKLLDGDYEQNENMTLEYFQILFPWILVCLIFSLNILTMNFYQIFLLLNFAACSIVLSEKFPLENVSNKSVILSEIIAKYLTNYFSNEEIFVSIILSASKNDQIDFQKDFVIHLFENQLIKQFTHNILNRMDFEVRDHRNTINLILIDDSKSLA